MMNGLAAGVCSRDGILQDWEEQVFAALPQLGHSIAQGSI